MSAHPHNDVALLTERIDALVAEVERLRADNAELVERPCRWVRGRWLPGCGHIPLARGRE